jgi:hypothetical protein
MNALLAVGTRPGRNAKDRGAGCQSRGPPRAGRR